MRAAPLRRYASILLPALTLLVCLPALTNRSWWIDELITRDISRLPLYKPGFFSTDRPFTHSILAYTIHDTGPGPLMYLLEGFLSRWAEPLGREFWMRIPGIVAGVLTTLLFIRGVSNYAGYFGAIAASCMLALMPDLVEFYTGSRGYGWLMLLALVQWLAVATHYKAHGNRAWPMAVLAISSIAGVLINPMQLVWTISVFGALWCVSLRSKHGGRLPLLPLVLCTVITAVSCAAWLLFWRAGLQQARTGSATSLMAGLNWEEAFKRTLQNHSILSLISMNFVASVALVFRRNPAARLQACIGVVLTFASLAQLVVLSGRFFAAPRYFCALYVSLYLGVAFLVQWLIAYRRLRGKMLFHIPLVLGTYMLIHFGRAVDVANTSNQDWARAARYLAQHAGLNDIVLTGPNSEYGIYRTYADAGGVKAQAPRSVEDDRAVQRQLDTSDGLAVLLLSDKKVWFVTAAINQHRTPQYWRLVNERFKVAATIPGKNPILVLEKKAPIP